MKYKVKPFIFPVLFMLFCIFNIETVIMGMQKALSICAFSIVPSLFLFMVLSDITVSLLLCDETAALSPKAIAFLLGSLCGFPIGAYVCEKFCKSGALRQEDANRLLPFCNNTSPAFVIGAIGVSMFESKTIGIIIYFSQLIVSLIPVLFIKCQQGQSQNNTFKKSFSEISVTAIENSIANILKVCAMICVFTALLSVLENTNLEHLALIFEISCGSSLCSALYGKMPSLAIALCGFCCGFSGLCVHMQVLSSVKSFKINYINFAFCKLVQGTLTALLSLAGYYLLF